jgi:CDP-glucose 4,6-dehydratase
MAVDDAITANKAFYPGKRVLVTGHTGFKGAWLVATLHALGAEAAGYALAPEPGCLYEKIGGNDLIRNYEGDISDFEHLSAVIMDFRPELVLHLAARAIVSDCFEHPRAAFSVNVQGTANLLEAIRNYQEIRGVAVITTDKVYENKGDGAVYKETDPLGGTDPYAASKTCMEYLTNAYRRSYLQTGERLCGVATVRASNVLGGGDHVKSRLIPSILAALAAGKPVELRHPRQTRPWQSVLDALNGYLTVCRQLWNDPAEYSGPWNIGPTRDGIKPVAWVVEQMKKHHTLAGYVVGDAFSVAESETLGLDISHSLARLDWRPLLSCDRTLYNLVDYFKRRKRGEPERDICLGQVREFYGI